MRSLCVFFLWFLFAAVGLSQQGSVQPRIDLALQSPGANSKPEPDVLILTDGERLIGQLESATDSSVVFKSNMVGEVTVDWSKVQRLQSSQVFAAVPKGVKLRKTQDSAGVPHGTVVVTDHQMEITSAQAPPKTMPTDQVSNLIPEAAFEKAFERTSFFEGWKGGLTAGVSLVEATQNNETFTGAASLVRAVPSENWLDLRSRTIFAYTQSYGEISQPKTPTVKTSLYHILGEQDWYLSPRLFVFGQAIFDHNFSQGLYLQQTYGGGLGFIVFKTPSQEFDFRASADYIDQRFDIASLDKRLFGSIFGETYVRTFAHGILLNELAAITPAWNDTSAYSALASAALTFPVYHRLGLNLSALDNFLNDPPPGFKKNSFQFTAGATYSFK